MEGSRAITRQQLWISLKNLKKYKSRIRNCDSIFFQAELLFQLHPAQSSQPEAAAHCESAVAQTQIADNSSLTYTVSQVFSKPHPQTHPSDLKM